VFVQYHDGPTISLSMPTYDLEVRSLCESHEEMVYETQGGYLPVKQVMMTSRVRKMKRTWGRWRTRWQFNILQKLGKSNQGGPTTNL